MLYIYDSIKRPSLEYANEVLLYIVWLNACRAAHGLDSMMFGFCQKACTRQSNGYDCGIYAMQHMKGVLLGLESKLDSNNTVDYRYKIAFELMVNDLTPWM